MVAPVRLEVAVDKGDHLVFTREAAPVAQTRSRDLTGTFGGQRINYAATIGETILKNKDGVPEATIVTTSYIKEPRDPGRPVTFLFNGGPGSGTGGSGGRSRRSTIRTMANLRGSGLRGFAQEAEQSGAGDPGDRSHGSILRA